MEKSKPQIHLLSEIAYSCCLYDGIENFNQSYKDFVIATNASPDLADSDHRLALIKWLDQWGCRYAEEYHGTLSESIALWFKNNESNLPKEDISFWEMDRSAINKAGQAYKDLSERIASYQKRNARPKRIGPTGASKILFGLRPNSLIPWDEPIRKAFGCHKHPYEALCYIYYLEHSILIFNKLCHNYGFELKNLPQKIDRPQSTVPMIIDHYYWTSITRKCRLPDPDQFEKWAAWSREVDVSEPPVFEEEMPGAGKQTVKPTSEKRWSGPLKVKDVVSSEIDKITSGNESVTFTPIEVINTLKNKYPDINEESIRCQIIQDCVNHTSRRHYPSGQRDLYFRLDKGVFRLYRPDRDGKWDWRGHKTE